MHAMQVGLQEIGVDLAKSDFCITHLHADHYGLVPKLAQPGTTVYMGGPDKQAMESWRGWEDSASFMRLNGFPNEELQMAIQNHPSFNSSLDWLHDVIAVEEGDIIGCGEYHFTAVATPGHTPGHICLYEPQKRLLVSGDHILGDITPNITAVVKGHNPLKQFLASLDKIGGLDVDMVLPAHRKIITTVSSRIAELKHHHARRNEEILSILTHNGKTAYQTAAEMSWDIDADSWEAFPVAHARPQVHPVLNCRHTHSHILTRMSRASLEH